MTAACGQRDRAEITPVLPTPPERRNGSKGVLGLGICRSLLQVVGLGGLENTIQCRAVLFQMWIHRRVWLAEEAGTDLGRTDRFLPRTCAGRWHVHRLR